MSQERNFSEDVEFLRQHVETIVLQNDEAAAVAVVPQYQGRTMTSSATGDTGTSYGYINYDAIAADSPAPKLNLYGGEDRVWVSPEGGQYSIFFDPGVEMSFDNWRTPSALDTEPFELIDQNATSVSFQKDATFVNWSGTQLQTRIERQVHLLDRQTASEKLGVSLDERIRLCCHESQNRLTNVGDESWTPEAGLIGIWMLCMSKPSPHATLVVPFKASDDELAQGPESSFVNADYFGKLESDRLQVDRDKRLIYFLGDGQHRSKLGLTFDRVSPLLGSWDQQRSVLTIVQFNLPETAANGYNNNLWEHQDEPYAGDVINCYNDGLNESGSSLAKGGFYELETISPALALSPGDGYTHIHRTFRIEAASSSPEDQQALSAIAQQVLGVSIEEIAAKFN